jgi:hypothetical protein
MCEFVICWRVDDGRGNISIIRAPFKDEDIAKVERLVGVDRWAWDTGACWLEEWKDGMDVIEPGAGVALDEL